MHNVLALIMIFMGINGVEAKNHHNDLTVQEEPVAVVVEEAYVQEAPENTDHNLGSEMVEGVSSKDVEVSPVSTENMPSSEKLPSAQEVDIQEDISLD